MNRFDFEHYLGRALALAGGRRVAGTVTGMLHGFLNVAADVVQVDAALDLRARVVAGRDRVAL